MMKTAIRYMIVFMLLAGSSAAFAQEEELTTKPGDLINIDTAAIPAHGVITAGVDFRSFGAQENLGYGSVKLGYVFATNWQGVIRGSVTNTRVYNGGVGVSHGGHDFEALIKHQFAQSPEFAVELGLCAPKTPTQNSVNVTLQGIFSRQLVNRVAIHAVAKSVFVKDQPIVGFGGGGVISISPSLELVGDITGIVNGYNARGIYDGSPLRSEVWGAGVRWKPNTAWGQTEVTVAVTNCTGTTTGFSLTPALSGSTAVMVGVTVRR